jgi:hypothetical protein
MHSATAAGAASSGSLEKKRKTGRIPAPTNRKSHQRPMQFSLTASYR